MKTSTDPKDSFKTFGGSLLRAGDPSEARARGTRVEPGDDHANRDSKKIIAMGQENLSRETVTLLTDVAAVLSDLSAQASAIAAGIGEQGETVQSAERLVEAIESVRVVSQRCHVAADVARTLIKGIFKHEPAARLESIGPKDIESGSSDGSSESNDAKRGCDTVIAQSPVQDSSSPSASDKNGVRTEPSSIAHARQDNSVACIPGWKNTTPTLR